MKWKKGTAEFSPEKTFLVIKDDLEVLESKNDAEKGKQRGKPKRTDLGTWPPKMKRGSSYNDERPKTANLEKPSVLDPNLLNKLDMSLLSKELLTDSMTRFHLSKAMSGGTSSSRCRQNVAERRQQSPRAANGPTGCNDSTSTQYIRHSLEHILDAKFEHVDIAEELPRMQKQPRVGSQDALAMRKAAESRKLDNNNNRNGGVNNKIPSVSTLKKKSSRSTIQNDIEVFTSTSAKIAPEPCKSCGKSDQPERFHSHPKSNQKPKETPISLKSKSMAPKSVQKPIGLNFRSDKSKKTAETEETKEKPEGESPKRPFSAPTKKGPRTVTCYICGREFGSASFPIHEPKCMQKWERENNTLPSSQRCPPPKRPDMPIDHSEWNAAAWEKSQCPERKKRQRAKEKEGLMLETDPRRARTQPFVEDPRPAQLIPCSKCGRTFIPDRLMVHQKSCKAKNSESEKPENPISEKLASTSRVGPPMIACPNCGKNFGSKSIKIHEPQCIKRSKAENERQSVDQRRKESNSLQKFELSSLREASISPTGDGPQKRTITCYICGRDFGSSSIEIHEPQCLKKWHAENAKLSPSRRRKEPQRPEMIHIDDPETGNMVIDVDAMAEASWKSHLSQLIPCKYCKRTFNPGRIDVHERSCIGSR